MDANASPLTNRPFNLREDLKCVRLHQENDPDGEHNDNPERHGVFDDALSLVTQEGFCRRSQVVSTFRTWDERFFSNYRDSWLDGNSTKVCHDLSAAIQPWLSGHTLFMAPTDMSLDDMTSYDISLASQQRKANL